MPLRFNGLCVLRTVSSKNFTQSSIKKGNDWNKVSIFLKTSS